MSDHKISDHGAIDRLWFTRCNVPTASGIAARLGWLSEHYRENGITIAALQDAPLEIAKHHYDHLLPELIREGGNVPAIIARANGSPTRLLGLTWIDEQQAIVVRTDAGIAKPSDLRGARIAMPAWAKSRETSMARAMALHGFVQTLALDGLTLNDVTLVNIPLEDIFPPGRLREARGVDSWPGIGMVAQGLADAAYIKGAAASKAAVQAGLAIVVNLDLTPSKRSRVNNGTPRPITAHQKLLDERPDLAVDFLALTLRACEWARNNAKQATEIVAEETQAAPADVLQAYGPEFVHRLEPSLAEERLELLEIQKAFLLRHGFISCNFSVHDWLEPGIIQAASARARADFELAK